MANSTPSAPTKVTFGVPSLLFKDTPQIATVIATICLYAAVIANAALIFFPAIPTPIKITVGEYSTAIAGFVHFLCNMFGLTPANPPSLPPTK